MINEKANSNSDWKNKLDELESLAAEKFNKEASWEKLHALLESKSKNKKIIWYWLAAACLFFALFISFFLSNNKKTVLAKNNFVEKKINSSSAQHVPMINKNTSSVISSLSTKNKIAVHSIKDIDKINTSINHKIIRTEIVQNKKEENIMREFDNNAVIPVDTAISIVANLPQKKKLKVVHINELGDPVSESPNVARSSEHHSFEFKLINQEVYTGSPDNSHMAGFNIFKTKNAPSN